MYRDIEEVGPSLRKIVGEDLLERGDELGAHLRLRGDEDGYEEWNEGLLEGKEARVLGATLVGKQYVQVATVQLGGGEKPAVPVKYLKPVPPRRSNGKALVLGGSLKGKLVTPKDRGGGQWLVQFDTTLEEVADELLCIREDPETPFEP